MKKQQIDVKFLAYMGLLIGLSYVGSFIRIFQSIALDSLAGYFAAFLLGPMAGGIVTGAGHMLTAINSGFPSSFPLHIVIMLGMGLGGYLVGWTYRKFGALASIVTGVVFNGPVLLGILWPLSKLLGMPVAGKAFFMMLILPLSLASLVNLVLAYMVYRALENKI